MEFFLVEEFSHAAFVEAVGLLVDQGWQLLGAPAATQQYDVKTDEWTFYYTVAVVKRKPLLQRLVAWWCRVCAGLAEEYRSA